MIKSVLSFILELITLRTRDLSWKALLIELATLAGGLAIFLYLV